MLIDELSRLRVEVPALTSFSFVFPGGGDPTQGWISADRPLGTALLGCGACDRVVVDAPAGRRIVAVVSVE